MLIVLLVVASATSLVLGLTTGPFALVWVGLGLSLVGLVLIGANIRAGRAGIDGAGGVVDGPGEVSPVAGSTRPDAPGPAAVEPADVPAPVDETGAVGTADAETGGRSGPGDVPARAEVVVVVPGRRRYHLAGCRLVGDRDTDEIGRDEAEEEGFTACTVCSAVPAPAVSDASQR